MKKFLKGLIIAILAIVAFSVIMPADDSSSEILNQPAIDFNTEFGWKSMYYYNQLDDSNKDAYIRLYSAVKNFEEKCTLRINSETLKNVFTAVLYDNPDIFWVENNYKYYNLGNKVVFKPEYTCSAEDAFIYSNELNAKINEILEQATFCVSDYDKELFFNDYICQNTVYDIGTYGTVGASAHNTLVNGRAVCEGYARSMQILLDKSGIYNYLIIGDATSDSTTEPHMWNIITLNGENYHLDVTWNDSEERDEPSYIYFNVTDEQISRDHSNFAPSSNNCYNNYYNYSVRNGTYAYTFYGFSQFADASANILRRGKNCVEICFKNKADYNKAINIIDNDNAKFFDYVGSAVRKSGRNLSSDKVDFFADDEMQYICIIFKEG